MDEKSNLFSAHSPDGATIIKIENGWHSVIMRRIDFKIKSMLPITVVQDILSILQSCGQSFTTVY